MRHTHIGAAQIEHPIIYGIILIPGSLIARTAQRIHYRYSSRAFHLQMAHDSFHRSIRAIEANRISMHPGAPPNLFLPRLDLRNGPGTETAHVLHATPLDTWFHQHLVADCPMMEARVMNMVMEFMGQRDTNKRLIDVQFSWTMERCICLMVEFEPDRRTDRWKILRSVSRFRCVRCL